ncbi:uberolysin/carnocyclin family circular bacteriocin [Cellulomonas hominis]
MKRDVTQRGRHFLAFAIGAFGLVGASFSVMYVAGMFGLSTAFASQIVNAVSVGGWVLAVVMAAISGGIAGAVVATARWAIGQWGKAVAVA